MQMDCRVLANIVTHGILNLYTFLTFGYRKTFGITVFFFSEKRVNIKMCFLF